MAIIEDRAPRRALRLWSVWRRSIYLAKRIRGRIYFPGIPDMRLRAYRAQVWEPAVVSHPSEPWRATHQGKTGLCLYSVRGRAVG